MSRDEYYSRAEQEISSNKAYDGGGEEKRSSGKIGIGQILSDEREKRGLNYAQISEKIRVRPHILEALEKEDWAKLPPRIIVKGFIRSYARFLELEAGELTGLYQKAFPVEPGLPTSHGATIQSGRNLIIFLVFLFLTIGSSICLLQESIFPQKVHTKSGVIEPKSYKENKPAGLEKADGKKNTSPLIEKKATTSSTEADRVGDSLIQASPPEREDQGGDKIPFSRGGESSKLILTGSVKAMTWIKVFVDDHEPKEFIFQMGETFQWEAQKGFDIIIGNAGGLDLVFEGKEVRSLGNPGQVVRLTLPENYTR